MAVAVTMVSNPLPGSTLPTALFGRDEAEGDPPIKEGLMVLALLEAIFAWLLFTPLPQVESVTSPVELVLGILLSVLPWGALVLAARTRAGPARSVAHGTAAYLAIGLAWSIVGIPGFAPPFSWYLLPMWPFFLLWIHPCVLGVGLWPC